MHCQLNQTFDFLMINNIIGHLNLISKYSTTVRNLLLQERFPVRFPAPGPVLLPASIKSYTNDYLRVYFPFTSY